MVGTTWPVDVFVFPHGPHVIAPAVSPDAVVTARAWVQALVWSMMILSSLRSAALVAATWVTLYDEQVFPRSAAAACRAASFAVASSRCSEPIRAASRAAP